MHPGTPIHRHWIFVLKDGRAVIDWGKDLAQDIQSGEFLRYHPEDFSHAITDRELEMLRHGGRISYYDARQVYLYPLPEPPRRTID